MSEFTLDELIGEIGISQNIVKVEVKKTQTRSAGKSPAQAFIAEVRKQIAFADEAAKFHTITEKHGLDGPVLDVKDSEKLAPPSRGKPSKWFVYKSGALVVSSYYGNSLLFPSLALNSWDAVIKYLNGLIGAANAGKLDANFAAIEKKRRDNRAANAAKKAGLGTEPTT
ncbi:MAG: hypothetical protein WCO00_10375 [Rhodospirillaceae bacterium]